MERLQHHILVLGIYLQIMGSVRLECLPPALPLYSVPEPQLNNQTSLMVGSYITWSCEEGFFMSGITDVVVWVCTSDGSWLGQPPNCTVNLCPQPPMPAYATTNPDPLAEANDTDQITYVCDNGYVAIGDAVNTCGQDGMWSNMPPVCEKSCSGEQRYSHHTCFRERGRGTWQDAVETCDGNEEIVALVKDDTTQDYLVEILLGRNTRGDVWIGAREGFDWKWDNSQIYIDMLFWRSHFSSSSEECILMQYHLTERYFWNGESCSEQYGFICQFTSSCEENGREPQEFVVDYRGNCFKFKGNVMKTWDDSKSACFLESGYLAEVPDESTHDFLVNIATKWENMTGTRMSWWIGGYDENLNNFRSWFWADNTRVLYTAWDDSEPDSRANRQYVKMKTQSDYLWENVRDNRAESDNRILCQSGIPACGDPGEPPHGSRTPDDRTTFYVGAKMEFHCDTGYNREGTPSISCLTNGTWNYERPTCRAITCDDNIPKVDQTINVTVLSPEYRGVAVYRCLPGYLPDDQPISYCQHNTSWSKPLFTCSVIPTTTTSSTTVTTTNTATQTRSQPPIIVSSSTVEATEADLSTEPGSQSKKGVIAGSTLTVLLCIVLIVILVVVIMRRQKPSSKTDVNTSDGNELTEYASVENFYETANDVKPDNTNTGTENVNGAYTDLTLTRSHETEGGLSGHAFSEYAVLRRPASVNESTTDNLDDYVYYQSDFFGKGDEGAIDISRTDDIIISDAEDKGTSKYLEIYEQPGGTDSHDQEVADAMVVNELYAPSEDEFNCTFSTQDAAHSVTYKSVNTDIGNGVGGSDCNVVGPNDIMVDNELYSTSIKPLYYALGSGDGVQQNTQSDRQSHQT